MSFPGNQNCFAVFILILFVFRAFTLQAAIERIDFPKISLAEKSHSMANPGKYSRNKLPLKLREAIAGNSVSRVIVFQGGQKAAKSYFKTDYDLIEVSDSYDDGKTTSYFSSPENKLIIDFRNYGHDAALHKALIYHFAGIPINQMQVFIDTQADNFNRAFYETARKAGRVENLIIGYRRSLVRDFSLRKMAALKARNLKNIFSDEKNARIIFKCLTECYVKKIGSTNLFRFVQLLRNFSVFLKDTKPEDLFRSHREYYRLAEAESEIVKIIPPKLPEELETIISSAGFRIMNPDAIRSKRIGIFLETPFDMTRFKIIKTDGTETEIFALKHPFGNTAASLVRHFIAAGFPRILFIGSAGGLSKGLSRGDLVIPSKFALIDRDMKFIPGEAANRLSDASFDDESLRIKRVLLHCSIPSPLLETRDLQNQLEERGAATIDCEGSHLFRRRNFKGASVKRIPSGMDRIGLPGAVFIITDLPGTEATLEEFESGDPDLLAAQMRMLDVVIQYFQIEDILLE